MYSEKKKALCRYLVHPWTAQMCENNKIQIYTESQKPIPEALVDSTGEYWWKLVTRTQHWINTPQGQAYWEVICDEFQQSYDD